MPRRTNIPRLDVESLNAGTLGVDEFAPTDPPVVPETEPDVDDVIAALLALGLIVQEDED